TRGNSLGDIPHLERRQSDFQWRTAAHPGDRSCRFAFRGDCFLPRGGFVKELMNSPCVYLEIGQSSLKALNGEDGLELPLERLPSGRLTPACKARLKLRLQDFLRQKSWQGRGRVFCAIGARGVSLRRLSLPAATKENFQRLLRLQIES